jgi:hypothetical protein
MQYVIWLSLFGLFSTQALAQRAGGFGGFGHGGFGRGGVNVGGSHTGFPRGSFRGGSFGRSGFGFPSQGFGNFGLPPVGPIPPLGVSAFGNQFGFDNQFGFGPRFFSSSAFFPFAYPLFLGGDEAVYPPAPNTIIVEPPPPPPVIVQQMPRETVRAAIHEYQPTATAEPVPGQEQPAFAIVLNDGSVQSAVAVSVQDDVLQYVDPDGEHRRVPLETVDRQATRRVNREQKLELRLPPPTAK